MHFTIWCPNTNRILYCLFTSQDILNALEEKVQKLWKFHIEEFEFEKSSLEELHLNTLRHLLSV